MKKQKKQPRTILRVEVSPDFKKELESFCESFGEKYSTVCRMALREFMAKRQTDNQLEGVEPATISNGLTFEQLKDIIEKLEDGNRLK